MDNVLTNLLNEAIKEDKSDKAKETVDIITFSEAPWGLNQPLRPMQKLVFKALYNLPFDNKKKVIELRRYPDERIYDKVTEVEMLYRLLEEGRTNINPDDKKGLMSPKMTLCLVAGRRSFKTFLASLISSYTAYQLIMKEDPQGYYGLPQNEEIIISNIANNSKQAKTLFRALKGHVINSSFFKQYITASLEGSIKMNTPKDIEEKLLPSILITALSCSARGSRGSGMISLVTDEFAHFQNNDGQQSDKEIFKALSPSTATFVSPTGVPEGKVIAISSPLGEQGVMFDLATEALEGNDSICYFRFPTWEANPKITMAYLKNEEAQSGTQDFQNEYGAEWLGGSSAYIDIPDKLRNEVKEGGSVDKNLKFLARGRVGELYYLGIDAGYQTDGFAISLVHYDPPNIILDHSIVFYAGQPPFEKYDVLPPNLIADYIARLYKDFNIRKGVMDQWEAFGLLQLLSDRGVSAIERQVFDRALNSRLYKAFRQRVYFGNFRMPNDQELIKDMLRLKVQKFKGNDIKVAAPEGFHDDFADAIVRAVWVCEEEVIDHVTPVTMGVRGSVTNRSGYTSANRQARSFLKQAANARYKSAYYYQRSK